MVISVNRTNLKHAAKGQKRAVPPEFLFFVVLNFNNLLVTCIGKIQIFGWQKVDVIAYC